VDSKAFFFYLFASVTVFAALRVVTARNPVHSVLYLMLTFFSAAAIWLLLRAEFLASRPTTGAWLPISFQMPNLSGPPINWLKNYVRSLR
jgi:hypothetical protein